MSTTFDDFLADLLAFESGWDRERYDAGIIQDWQLDTWAGGSVETYFPDYSSWSQLTDAEWTSMAYRSMNSYGFVGYQFGEALLIDLGYYDDNFYYGNGAATNTWDGTWTGKNGVDSLAEFMTAEAQDVAIREEFGFNLNTIETGLSAAGQSLEDFLGTTRTYVQNGEEVTVTLTLTGILAAAHLRGAPAVVALLLSDTVSADEYGTSILQYIEQFGGYDAPATAELITYFEDRLTGDEGLGVPGDGTDVAYGNGTAGVTADSADVVITWTWGQDAVVTDFDPASDTIFVDWFTAGDVSVSEVGGSVVFSIPANNQSVTLQGVALEDLSPVNFTVMDSGLAGEIFGVIGTEASAGEGGSDTSGGDTAGGDTTGGDTTGGDTSSGEDANGNSGSDSTGAPINANGTANVTKADATVVVTWAWGHDTVINDFDPASDTIFVDWFHSGDIAVSETDGNVVFAIPDNNQTITLVDVSLADLTAANFTIMDSGLGAEILGAVSSGNADGSSDGWTDPNSGKSSNGSDGNTDPVVEVGSGGAEPNGEVDVYHLTWNWSATETISDFAPAEDVLDLGSLSANLVSVSEVNGDLVFEVLNNGGHVYVLEGVQAEDLTAANFTAPSWNGVLEDPNGVFNQLAALGNQEFLLS